MSTHRLFTLNSYLKYRVLAVCPQTFFPFFGQFDTADKSHTRARRSLLRFSKTREL